MSAQKGFLHREPSPETHRHEITGEKEEEQAGLSEALRVVKEYLKELWAYEVVEEGPDGKPERIYVKIQEGAEKDPKTDMTLAFVDLKATEKLKEEKAKQQMKTAEGSDKKGRGFAFKEEDAILSQKLRGEKEGRGN